MGYDTGGRGHFLVQFLDKVQLLLILALVFIIPFSKAGIEIFFIAAFIIYLIKHLAILIYDKKFSFLPATPFKNILLIFFVINVISVLNSPFGGESLEGVWAKIGEYLMVFFMVVDIIKKRKDFYLLVAIFILSATLVSLNGIIQFISGQDIVRHFTIRPLTERIRSCFNTANDMAGYFTLIIPVILSFALTTLKTTRAKTISILLVAVNLFCFIFSFSRSAIAGVLCSILFIVLLLRKIKPLLVGVFILLFLLLFPNLSPKTLSQSSTTQRLNSWGTSLRIVADQPLFGWGVNTYCSIYPYYSPEDTSGYAHNCYLQMASEIGVVGLGVFFYFLYLLIKKGSDKARECNDVYTRFILIGIIGGIIAFLIHSFVDTNMYSLKLATAFWYMAGVAAGTIKLEDKKIT